MLSDDIRRAQNESVHLCSSSSCVAVLSDVGTETIHFHQECRPTHDAPTGSRTPEGFTGDDMFFEDQSLQSVVYQGSSKSETVSFCGSSIKVWKPDYAVDDSTSNTLDGSLTFSGMLTEVGNLDRVGAGKPLWQSEATAKADEYGVRIIPCRWVTTEKVIDREDGVRARIVVKDIASGGGKAKSLGISSPTPSAESIKMALGIGGYSNVYGWTLDCSAAFMHTPLRKERKVIVRFPASMSWPDNSPLFMDLSKSLNGIRSASLDWLEYVQGIVKPLGLTCDVTSPCVFTAPGTVMIIYVDDLLIFSNKPDMGKKIWEKLNAVVPTKVTGQLFPKSRGVHEICWKGDSSASWGQRTVGWCCTRVSRFLLS